MSTSIVLAMDLATNSSDEFVVKDGPSETIMEGSVDARWDELEELVTSIREKRPNREIKVVLEATGMAWFPIAVFFNENEIPLYRVKAQQSEQFRTFLDRYTKTDQVDAQALGRMYYLIPDQLYEIWFPIGDLHSLRRWVNRREDLVQNRASEKQRFQALIKMALPELAGKLTLFSGKKMRDILAHVVDYQWTCVHMGEERFKQWARDRNGQITDDQLDQLFEAARQARKLYQDSDYDPQQKRVEALDLLDHIRYLDERIEDLQDRMQELHGEILPDKPVESVYGFDWLGASVMKSYLGDGSRFPNLNQAECWVGFIPEVDQSGNTNKKGTPIRKDGPSVVRKFLYLATDTARQWDPQIARTYHDQMVNRGKTHTQAICKCANKQLARVLRVLDDGEEYELRNNQGEPIDWKEAREIIREKYTVPEEIRKQRRSQTA